MTNSRDSTGVETRYSYDCLNRRIAIGIDYLPYYDSYQLTATVRLALVNFDTDVAAALYNVTV